MLGVLYLKMIFGMAVTSGEVTTSLIILVMVLFCKSTRKQREKGGISSWPMVPPHHGKSSSAWSPSLSYIHGNEEKYEDVFLIKLGMVPVLVVNGMEMVKEVLLKSGEHFAAWPNMCTFSFLVQWRSLMFSVNYGESCQLHEKIAFNALWTFFKAETKSSTCSCLLEEHVIEEVSELVKVFTELTSKSGSFEPRGAIICAMANVACALCFGKRYDHGDEFLRIVKNIWWLTQGLQCCEFCWFHTMFLIPSFAN